MLRDRFLKWLTQVVIKHSRAIIIIVAALSLVSILFVGLGYLEIDTSRSAMFSKDSINQIRFEKYLKEFGTPYDLILIVEGESPAANRDFLKKAARELVKEKVIREVMFRIPFEDFKAIGMFYLKYKTLADFYEGVRKYEKIMTESFDLKALPSMVNMGNALKSMRTSLQKNLFSEDGGKVKGAGPDILKNTLLFLQTLEKTFHYLTRLIDDPKFNPSALIQEQLFYNSELKYEGIDDEGYLSVNQGKQLIAFVKPAEDSDKPAFIIKFYNAAKKALNHCRVKGVTFGMTGIPAQLTEEQLSVSRDIYVTTIISLIALILLFVVVFRMVKQIAFVMASLVAGLCLSLGFVLVTYGHLTILTSGYLAMLVGLGIDFGLNIFIRFVEERSKGKDTQESVLLSMRYAGKGIITAGMLTILSFFATGITGFKAFRELAVIAGSGLLIVLILTLVFLPALLIRLKGGILREKDVKFVQQGSPFLRGLFKYPLFNVILSIGITIFLVSFLTRVYFNIGISSLLPKDAESVEYLDKLNKTKYYGSEFNIVVANSLEELRRLNQIAKTKSTVLRTQSLLDFLPQKEKEKLEIFKELKKILPFKSDGQWGELSSDLTQIRAELKKLHQSFQEDLYFTATESNQTDLAKASRQVAKEIEALQKRLEKPDQPYILSKINNLEKTFRDNLKIVANFLDQLRPVRPIDLPSRVVRNLYKNERGQEQFVLMIYPRVDIFQRENLRQFVKESLEIHPEVLGFPMTHNEFTNQIMDGFQRAGIFSFLVILLILFLDFKGIRRVLLSLFPLILGVLWMLGAINLLNIEFNFANIVAVPLILGVGIAYGVYYVNRHRETVSGDPIEIVTFQGKAIFLSAVTTIIGFGALIFGTHRGIIMVGWSLTIGVAACMITSLFVLPSWALLWRKYYPPKVLKTDSLKKPGQESS